MRKIHRGRVFRQWVKKTSNFLSPGKVKNQEILSGFSKISTFEQYNICLVLKNLSFCPGVEISIVLHSIFPPGYSPGGSDRVTDTEVFESS